MPNTINDWNPALNQVQATLNALDSLAVAGNVGNPAPAIDAQCGILTQRLTNLSDTFNGILADGTISNADKTAFLRQAYLDLSALQTQLGALTSLLRESFTDASGVFLFENQTNLFTQSGEGIVRNYNIAAPNFGLGKILIPVT